MLRKIVSTFLPLLAISPLFGGASLVKKSSAYGLPTTVVRYIPPSSPTGDPTITGAISAEGFKAFSSNANVFDYQFTTDQSNFIVVLSGLTNFTPNAGFTFGVLACNGTTGVQCTPEPPWTDNQINAQVTVLQSELNGIELQITGDARGLVLFVEEDSAATPTPPTLQIKPVPTGFIPITPCRVADTRNTPNGAFAGPALSGQSVRDFAIPASACNIPAAATAYSLNVAVVPSGLLGYLTLWPSGQPQPLVATLNSDGRIKSTAAIIPAGANGAVSVYATDNTDLILDINGYFVLNTTPSALAFYPLTPCRLADTRNAGNPGVQIGGPALARDETRTLPIQSTACGIPANAQAYSLNFAALPTGPLVMTAWPSGESQPLAASVNAVVITPTANAVIVPAGANGSINVWTSGPADLVIDVNGYFAAPDVLLGGLWLYSQQPCRILDTRNPPGAQPFSGTVDFDITACGVQAGAQSYLLNATVVPATDTLGFLTLWPQGIPQPVVSTLNAQDGAITGNMAIVPTNNGSISIFAPQPTHLVLDLFGIFGK
jgi:hypothetical protein